MALINRDWPGTDVQAQADFAQSIQITNRNSIGEMTISNGTSGFVPHLTSNIIYKRPTFGPFNQHDRGGKIIPRHKIGEGTFGTCFRAEYYDWQTHFEFEMVAKLDVKKLSNQQKQVNQIPVEIIDEFSVHKKFRNIHGVVHPYHAAELTCPDASLSWLATAFFGGNSTIFTPSKGDRLFLFCLPAYDYDLGTCLRYENYFLHYDKMPSDAPPGAREPPKDQNAYLWLTIRRFYRLYNAVGQMHKERHGHYDIKPGNILLRHCQDQACVDLTDFGLATRWIDGCERSLLIDSAGRYYDRRDLRFRDAPVCYAPETVRTASSDKHGIPSLDNLFAGNEAECEEEFIAFDCWGLGYTLFAMCQAYFVHPDSRLGGALWSQQPGWLDDCHSLVKNFNTSSVIKSLILSFLEKDPTKRLSYVRGKMQKFSTPEALWQAHITEPKMMPPASANTHIS